MNIKLKLQTFEASQIYQKNREKSIIFVEKVEMKILVTNDDGYEAKGLLELVGILRPYGELTIVAPKKPQSGMSMAVSMGLRPLAAKKVLEKSGEHWWYLDGTPASCVKFGLDNVMFPERPDLVVSGINHGSNAATAALYSGTLGAAMEGAVNGIPSVGVSLDSFSEDADFSAVAELFPSILEKLLARPRRFGSYYNVNFPGLPADGIKGVRVCHMGRAHWEREYRDFTGFLGQIGRTPTEEDLGYVAAAEAGEEIFVMAGDFTDNGDNAGNTDHILLDEGYITVTPHNIDNSDREEGAALREIFI